MASYVAFPIDFLDGVRCPTEENGPHRFMATPNGHYLYCQVCLLQVDQHGRVIQNPHADFAKARG